MKRKVFSLGAVVLVVAVVWIRHGAIPRASLPTAPVIAEVIGSGVVPDGKIGEATPPPIANEKVREQAVDPRTEGSPLARELDAAKSTPERDVEVLYEMLRQYLRALHRRQGRPIGNDSDLAIALTGHNPMHLIILPPDHRAVRADGRLCDRWGTPFFIHPRGNDAFEIRSAGPDRRMFTADDLVANPGPLRDR